MKDPILRACERGDVAGLQQLLAEKKTGDLTSFASTAVRKPSVLAVLLDHGLDPNYVLNRFGETLLNRAITEGQKASFDLLIQRGAKTDPVDKYGFSLLHGAAAAGQPEMARFLVEHGIKADIRTTNSQSTPLIEAARNNQVPVMEILFAHGADIEARDVDQATALIMAAKAGKFEAAEWLVCHGANFEARDYVRKTALDWADSNSHTKIVELLQTGKRG